MIPNNLFWFVIDVYLTLQSFRSDHPVTKILIIESFAIIGNAVTNQNIFIETSNISDR